VGDRPDSTRLIRHITHSAEETEELGRRLARSIAAPAVILLRGSLGAGKTTLTRGLAQGLGVPDPAAVSSPSFTLVNIYEGRCPVYHVDLYRLQGVRDIYSTGLDEFLGVRGVTIVEWSERLEFPVPSAMIVEIRDAGGNTREIEVRRSRGSGTGRRAGARKNKARSG
jgi:tRNA threonylcarbamoyladenosine biosynthesis protein TsaE